MTNEQRRLVPPTAADERATLTGFLDFQRATLEWKSRDLTDEQLRQPLSAHPSRMTLAGLLKHLAYVEDYWFSEVLGGATDVAPWNTVDWEADEDWDWNSAGQDSGEHLRALWGASIDRSRAVLDGMDDLGVTRPAWGGRDQVSVRWVLTHMIEEYARHNGHADLLRELIDGETGE